MMVFEHKKTGIPLMECLRANMKNAGAIISFTPATLPLHFSRTQLSLCDQLRFFINDRRIGCDAQPGARRKIAMSQLPQMS